ncbi:MAG TPA: hypothetical protein VNJ70_01670 [Thermoanaerobaculia bacterium]|nr:hypothetical protein [Thermoanaerobaculia bacterium]
MTQLGGAGSTVQAVYEFGESLVETVGEMALGLVDPRVLLPRTLYTLTGDPLQRSVEAVRLTLSGDAGAAFQELLNKSEIFVLVAAVSGLIGAPSAGAATPGGPVEPYPLDELVARCYALGDFQALWAIEGLGHEYGDFVWAQGEVPHGLLTSPHTATLPAGSLLMLHAGIGLSMAQHLLRGPSWESPAELRRLLAEIVGLDRANSQPGYLGAALESLGLVTRTFHPTLVPAVDRELRVVAPEAVGFFWHGVGRAIYFWIVNFLPCSAWQGYEMAAREATDELARLNAEAGMAWAQVLVNQRQPQSLYELIVKPHGEDLRARGGFVNGLASSIMMRFDTTPAAPFIEAFCRWEPPAGDSQGSALWDELVRLPCRQALEVWYPVLKRQHRLGEIFEFRDLAALTGTAGRGRGGTR